MLDSLDYIMLVVVIKISFNYNSLNYLNLMYKINKRILVTTCRNR